MSGTRPRFSVVIPTFNRAVLLPFAVGSVLQQTFDDFEIVISNGGSTDNTDEVVEQFGDRRIRYIKADRRISGAENYQQGLDAASGEFITFLSDDDAYTPDLFRRVAEVVADNDAEIVGYQYARYYPEELLDFDQRIPANSLLISKFDRGLTKFRSSEALQHVLAVHGLRAGPVEPRFICPYLSNAVYSRDIFDRLKKVRPNLFDLVPADIYLAAAVFFEVETYYCLDEPLLVWRNWEGNATASAQRTQNKIREHYERLLDGRELGNTPLKFASQLNCSANTIIQALNDLGDGALEIDWAEYFHRTFENFIYLKSVGIDTSPEEREFGEVLKQQPMQVQAEIRERSSGLPFRTKALLNSHAPKVSAMLRRVLKKGSVDALKVIRGSEGGFSDILEAASAVPINRTEK